MPSRLLTTSVDDALGRGPNRPLALDVRKIVKRAAADDYRFATIIAGIVDSLVQMRTRLEPDLHRRPARTAAMMITKKHPAASSAHVWRSLATALDARWCRAAQRRQDRGGRTFRFGAIYMPTRVFPDTWHQPSRRELPVRR
jgi:hypothetical protein